ncbi:MAG: DMT family transporter [Actinomycetota bacterium]|nr:DMT family transporter [Actinomycetota bacterium]
MGILMALAAGALLGLNAVFIKIGMRRGRIDNGHFMSVLVNVLFLGVVMLFVSLPRWSWIGFGGFILAGLLTTWLGRGSSFTAIRLIGPPRQGAILVSSPLFAAIGGWFFLGEGITLVQGLGGLITLVGLWVLLRSRLKSESSPSHSGMAHTLIEAPDATEPISATRAETADSRHDFTRGFLIALMAAFFFGSGFVARKWGLSYFPSAVAGAFFGACTALSMIVLSSAARGNVRRLLEENFRQIPWWFVAGGIALSISLLLQFSSFSYLPAWIVSLLLTTQAVWTLLWTWLFLRDEERIGRELLLSIAFVLAGVAVMTYGP